MPVHQIVILDIRPGSVIIDFAINSVDIAAVDCLVQGVKATDELARYLRNQGPVYRGLVLNWEQDIRLCQMCSCEDSALQTSVPSASSSTIWQEHTWLPIVLGAIGGVLFLSVIIVVAIRCGRERSKSSANSGGSLPITFPDPKKRGANSSWGWDNDEGFEEYDPNRQRSIRKSRLLTKQSDLSPAEIESIVRSETSFLRDLNQHTIPASDNSNSDPDLDNYTHSGALVRTPSQSSTLRAIPRASLYDASPEREHSLVRSALQQQAELKTEAHHSEVSEA